ncbi:MAG: shikimate kinase [Ruminococcaceae bacterium]|nr:shikimate kinase [Oscillospiraceae bacterium]
MKLLFIIGSGAVGKMTVGQELMKITDLRLFHNHMMIEPVIDIFGHRDTNVVNRLRDVIFEEFARSDSYGLIFTYMWAFDHPECRAYVEHVKSIFEPYGTGFYCVELIASQEVRLARNATENRLLHKASKRDVELSAQRLIREDSMVRLVSNPGEIPFDNYLRLDNSDLSPAQAANIIKEHFNL